jgi:hypothetical protein
VPTVRRGDAAGEVHEPVVVLLPEMPTAPTGPANLIAPTMRRVRWQAITLLFVAPFIGEVTSHR